MRSIHKVLSIITIIASVVSLSSCSKSEAESNNAMTGVDTGKFASGMTDLIDSLLDDDQYDESQKEVLRAALQHDGEIPYASYSAAWESYRQCLVDKGYTKPPQNLINGIYFAPAYVSSEGLTEEQNRKLINGIYFAPAYVSSEGLTEEQNRKLNDDINACRDARVAAIDLAYRTKLGNPEFYGDPEVALVDCLHRKNLVPQNYTIDQYRKESDLYMNDTSEHAFDRFSFDIWKPLG